VAGQAACRGLQQGAFRLGAPISLGSSGGPGRGTHQRGVPVMLRHAVRHMTT